ncbi:MAG: hypothetical protein CME36_09550 [unclassified Hahellaceae]|nr:hypothetical protein [Hahellaceae bacterium]|tara:strand:- start:16917 stop:17924 length:1008 start_codon:yes stop_codon:yes gene_type:complete
MVDKAWRHQTHKRASLVFQQYNKLLECAPSKEAILEFENSSGNRFFELLDKLYGEEYQLARLMDSSDLVFHAEGPAAKDSAPQLKALNWLTKSAEKSLRYIGESIFDSVGASDGRKLSQKLDLRLTGMAPGSMYMGFSLADGGHDDFDSLFDESHQQVIDLLVEAFSKLALVPNYITDDDVDRGIGEIFLDPAVRDATLLSVYNLCPTGRLGLHTLDITGKSGSPGQLSQRERVVLRESIFNPVMSERIPGEFLGTVRQIDLDTKRFQLRGVKELGSIRCVTHMPDKMLKTLLGKTVVLKGLYERDKNGKPKLFEVREIKSFEESPQEDLYFFDQ